MLNSIFSLFPVAPVFYHWRNRSGAEVDIVLDYNGVLFPVEIKYKSHSTGNDARGIHQFMKDFSHRKIAKGMILYPGQEAYPVNPDVMAWPIYTNK